MRNGVKIFLDPKNEKETFNSLDKIVVNRNDFSFLENLTELFHKNKSSRQKDEIYFEIVDFTLDYYNYCVKNGNDERSSRVSALYKAGIRELDYYNSVSQRLNNSPMLLNL